MEIKQLALQATELKFGTDGNAMFSGYASVFNGVDSYGDTIESGAYKRTLADRERPVLLRWNHYGPVIGKFTSIVEDEKGLFVEGELTKGHSVADDVSALLRHGAVSGMSIGYIAKDYADNSPHVGRKLTDIELIEISVVEEPADNAARIDSVKSALSTVTSLKEVEHVMRQQFNLSQQESTAMVSAVKNLVNQGEPEQKLTDAEKLAIYNFCKK